jgi:uncharacterized protein (TIGR03067 family)
MRTAILFSLVAGSFAAAAPGAKDPPPPKASPLVGEWEIVTVTTQGKTRPNEFGGIFTFTADGKHGIRQTPEDKILWREYRVDEKAEPKTMDIVSDDSGKQTVVRWLYEVKGDTLKICYYSDDDTRRPKELEAGKGSKNVIHTLKRVKPKK